MGVLAQKKASKRQGDLQDAESKWQYIQMNLGTNSLFSPWPSHESPWCYRKQWRLASACTPSDRLSNKCRILPFPLHEFAMPDQSGNLGPVQYWCSWQNCLFERLNSTFAWSNNLIVLTGSLLFKRFNSFCCQESEFAFSMKLSQGKAFLSQTSPKVFLIAFHALVKHEIMQQIHILNQKNLGEKKVKKQPDGEK